MQQVLPTLERTAGKDNVIHSKPVTGAEDFSFFQKEIPGVYLWIGGKPVDVAPEDAPADHTPEFMVSDKGMQLGVELLTNLTIDTLFAEVQK